MQIETEKEYRGAFKADGEDVEIVALVRWLSLPEYEAMSEGEDRPRYWIMLQGMWMCTWAANGIPSGRFFEEPGTLINMENKDDVLEKCLGLARERGLTKNKSTN